MLTDLPLDSLYVSYQPQVLPLYLICDRTTYIHQSKALLSDSGVSLSAQARYDALIQASTRQPRLLHAYHRGRPLARKRGKVHIETPRVAFNVNQTVIALDVLQPRLCPVSRHTLMRRLVKDRNVRS